MDEIPRANESIVTGRLQNFTALVGNVFHCGALDELRKCFVEIVSQACDTRPNTTSDGIISGNIRRWTVDLAFNIILARKIGSVGRSTLSIAKTRSGGTIWSKIVNRRTGR